MRPPSGSPAGQGLLTEAERIALRRHVLIIERYEAELAREEARLSEPYLGRLRELEAELRRHDPEPVDDVTGSVAACQVWRPGWIDGEIQAIWHHIQDGLAA